MVCKRKRVLHMSWCRWWLYSTNHRLESVSPAVPFVLCLLVFFIYIVSKGRSYCLLLTYYFPDTVSGSIGMTVWYIWEYPTWVPVKVLNFIAVSWGPVLELNISKLRFCKTEILTNVKVTFVNCKAQTHTFANTKPSFVCVNMNCKAWPETLAHRPTNQGSKHEPPLYQDNPNKLEIGTVHTGCTNAVESPAELKVSRRFTQL